MFQWLEEFLEIRYKYRQRKYEIHNEIEKDQIICESCETLKQQLSIANTEKKALLERLLEKPEKEVLPAQENLKPVMMPQSAALWKEKRAALEANDRAEAKALRQAANAIIAEKTRTEELETELLEAKVSGDNK